SRGVIPVAILGSESFDVADVDAATLAFFGPDQAPPLDRGCGGDDDDADDDCMRRPFERDVNGDGFTDLVTHFRTRETGIEAGDPEACLTGETFDGVAFEGCDAVVTLPPRERGFRGDPRAPRR
ncbi:MAG: hypothetical protein ACYS0K_21165, partial [Planctomycetota bacterium]